jgi:hypothetical protein
MAHTVESITCLQQIPASISPAEEEMIESALIYETKATRLGTDFLDNVQRVIDSLQDQCVLS